MWLSKSRMGAKQVAKQKLEFWAPPPVAARKNNKPHTKGREWYPNPGELQRAVGCEDDVGDDLLTPHVLARPLAGMLPPPPVKQRNCQKGRGAPGEPQTPAQRGPTSHTVNTAKTELDTNFPDREINDVKRSAQGARLTSEEPSPGWETREEGREG